jgi:transposase
MRRDYSQSQKRKPKATPSLPVINPHAAGIDIGSETMFVSVPTDSCPKPIASFGAYTSDLLEIANWLRECSVGSVAMESTGVYWIPLYEILEERGFDVTLVGPNYPKKPPKSDLEDCQWLQYLHSVGLLDGSFRPPEVIRAIREVLRFRGTIVQQAAESIQRMQKSLTQMNLLLHNAISDITGVAGLAIVDAIVAGERDPAILARHRSKGMKSSVEVIEKSLTGHYRDEHLFTLRRSREAYGFYQKQIAECDAEIEAMLKKIDTEPPKYPPIKPTTKKGSHTKNQVKLPEADLRGEMTRAFGVDLVEIPGLGPNTVCTILAEVGTDLSSFPNAGSFASWLKLCPGLRSSGGKKLRGRTSFGKPPLANALRIAAQALHDDKSYMGQFYRKMRARFGGPIAVKATAHKLSRIIYAVISTKTPYDESHFAKAEERSKQRRLNRLYRDAAEFGLTLAPGVAGFGSQ